VIRRVRPLLAVALLAGCGSTTAAKQTSPRTPTLPRALATSFRSQADSVAAALADGDGCTAQARAVALRNSVIEAIKTHRVAPRFQETLTAAVNDLASRIACTPPPAPVVVPHPSHAHGHPKPPKHGHGHGHGKHT
jgi:uncharacterized lipoprotein YajG